MRTTWAWLCFGALGLSATSALAADIPPQPVEGKISWVYRYAEGKQLARQTGKPMLVIFRCER